MVEKAVPPMLNQMVLKPYGEMTSLKFESKRRFVEAEVKLKGETELVRIRIEEFELREESGRMFVSAKIIETSREWLTTLAREHATGRTFEVPESIRKYASMLV